MRLIKSVDKRTIITVFLYILCSFIFAKIYFITTREWRQSTAQQLVDFNAYKPFQYRVLIPTVMHIIRDISHINVETIFKGFTVLFVTLTVFSFRLLLNQFFVWCFSDIGALFILYPMAWNYCAYGYFRTPYDIPAIFFFTISLIYLLKERWWLFYVFFIVGVFNRETMLCITGVYILLQSDRLLHKSVIIHITIQITIWLAIKYTLSIIFHNNDGILFQHQIGENIKLLSNPRFWSPYIFAFGGLWALPLFSWREIHPLARRILLIAPLFYALMAYVANLHELRIYNELVPLFALSGLNAIGSIFGFGLQNKPSEKSPQAAVE